MDWLSSLLNIQSSIQAIIIVALICGIGLWLGKIRLGGISLGIAFVFFFGIFVGSLHLEIDHEMLDYCETFGLVLFVYALGLHVGPNFFGSLRAEGTALNLWSLGVIFLGTLLAVVLSYLTPIPMSDMIGVLCGATTNTPALGAAQQALEHAGVGGGRAALATAVTYPLGVLGVILAMMFIRKFFVKPDDLKLRHEGDEDHTFVGQYVVVNPALEGRTLAQIARATQAKFIVSRIWRQGQTMVPLASTKLYTGDNVLVVTSKEAETAMEMLFGQEVQKDWNKSKIDWNHIDANVESRTLVLTRTALNGRKLGQFHLRDAYGVNVSRITRGDIKLLATDNLRLQYGDHITVVGRPDALKHAEDFFGNSVKTLNEPNLSSIFIGMLLGLAIGVLPVVSYTTRSASLMLRKLGLSLYLACLGLDAGKGFLDTVMRPEGLLWVGVGFVLTLVPIVIVGLIALRTKKFDFGTICGILCGSMANPMALGYANDTLRGDTAAISYATVYPLGMFIRVIIAQVIVMFFVG